MSTYPPLTENQFAAGCAGRYAYGILVCEDENATWIYCYGHHDPRRVVMAVYGHDCYLAGDDSEPYEPYEVRQMWATTIEPPDGPDGWQIRWSDEQTPDSFPVSVIGR